MLNNSPSTIIEVLTLDELEHLRSSKNLPVPVGFDPPTSGKLIELEAQTRSLARENSRAFAELQANLALNRKLIRTANEAAKLQQRRVLADFEDVGLLNGEDE
jgi:hypothetical protein